MKKNKIKMGEVDYILFYTVFLLVAIGIVAVYSASSYTQLVNAGDSMALLKKQGIFAIIGTIGMFFIMSIDYHVVKKWCGWILIGTIGVLIAVLFVGTSVKGARRWIDLGFFQFQPSEIAKYAIVVFLAVMIERNINKITSLKFVLFRLLFISAILAGLVLLEKNLSIASVIMIVSLIMIFAAGLPWKYIWGLILTCIVGGVGFILFEPYRLRRLQYWLDPFKDPGDKGYQLVQSFYALGAGGFTGLGLGQSRQKTLYMPEPHNDFIFAIIGEELGLIGCVIVILLFILLISRGVVIAMRAKDMLGSMIAIGTISVIAVQACINIAVVTGTMPVTGVPLPFISYGGTALVVNMSAMGLLLNVSRQMDK